MLFVIHALDGRDTENIRAAHYPAHKDFLATSAKLGVRVVMSGPLTTDDGSKALGSLFVLEASDRATVEAFHRNDPFFKARVWETVSIAAFDKRRG